MKIAIVGSGIAGLTAAWYLHLRHDVHLFEANDYMGGHANTVVVEEGDQSIPVDTGFIVFNRPNYPGLCKLFDELGVTSHDSDMSFSVRCEKTGLEYNGSDLNRIFSQRKNIFKPAFLGMLKNILRFNRQGWEIATSGFDDQVTVAEFVKRNNYSKQFVDYYLLPLGASLWSCPVQSFSIFPVRFVAEFLANHGMLQLDRRPVWKTVSSGSRQYIEKIIKKFTGRIYLNCPVQRISRRQNKIELTLSRNEKAVFDEVIMATHADTGLALVEHPDRRERHLLSHFAYQNNETVLHTDTSVLPKLPRTWASWNYLVPTLASDHVSVAYNMNRLQGINSRHTYLVSLNQTRHIDPAKVIRKIVYRHPLFRPGRSAVQAQHDRLIRRRGISWCGAYWGYGFHEDGVRSALAVCESYAQSCTRALVA